MFFKNKNKSEIDLEQHEQLEYAHARIKQKKKLYNHFILFLLGGVFVFLANKILKYNEQYNWYLWVILIWGAVFMLHFINVFVTQNFMGTEWEREQREKLVAKQKKKITELQKEIETDFPMANINKKKDPWEEPSP
ncbi:2TM domain-containing protein [Flavobacteriaceae bacterium F89]|uniref:2TM domain-containing protein n=1 Tax=Cerina litoralis TaxID=2874477 RepID=A0AAE3ESY6_9FLAO|nr:2TM domain-containing protein [Cerina litoralis]MCG2460587.1 2TM domain-containing protein [Cerina litoralis]